MLDNGKRNNDFGDAARLSLSREKSATRVCTLASCALLIFKVPAGMVDPPRALQRSLVLLMDGRREIITYVLFVPEC